jgi:dTDP-4-amino-4,6-dideoxygalactose transaminase
MRIGRTLAPAAPASMDWGALWRSAAGILSPGEVVQDVEEQLRRYFGMDFVWLVSSGTTGLTVILKALKATSPRTDVVIPAYTCFSVPAAVLAAGLRPVPCDIDPATFDFDLGLLERAVGPGTLAVLAHDLFGMPSDIDGIRALCRSRGVVVIEDAAQAMGVEHQGRKLGTRGDVGLFSLGRGKPLTCGAGGIIVTGSRPLARVIEVQYERLRAETRAEMWKDWIRVILMATFIRPWLYWMPATLPFLHLGDTTFPETISMTRLSAMQALLFEGWQDRLTAATRARANTSAEFQRRLSLDLPCPPGHPYLRLPVLLETREERARIHAWSRARGLGLGRGYPSAVGDIPRVKAAIGSTHCPAATRVADQLVTLPTHHWLSAKDQYAITDCLVGSRRASPRALVQQRAS